MPEGKSDGAAATGSVRARRRHDREVWVGLFALAAFATVITLGLVLKGRVLLGGGFDVYTYVPDAATLREGSPVQMRGVRIGRVQRVTLTAQSVRLRLRIDDDVPLAADARARVDPAPLIGQAAVEILPGQAPRRLRAGETIPGAVGTDAFDRALGLTDEAGIVLDRVARLLSEENVNTVAGSAEELRELLATAGALMNEQRSQVRSLTRSLQRSARGIERGLAGPELARIVAQTQELLGDLDRIATSLERTASGAASVTAQIQRGQGTLGELARDPSLYRNLSRAATEVARAAAEIRHLAADVRRNPKRYVDLSLF